MKRARIEKLAVDVRRHFPPPRAPGKIVVIKIFSDRMLSDEEVENRAGPPVPGIHRILLNVIKVRPFKRQASAEDGSGGRAGRPARGAAAAEEAALEAQVRRLEDEKKRLVAGADELDRRRRRVDQVKRAAADAKRKERDRI